MTPCACPSCQFPHPMLPLAADSLPGPTPWCLCLPHQHLPHYCESSTHFYLPITHALTACPHLLTPPLSVAHLAACPHPQCLPLLPPVPHTLHPLSPPVPAPAPHSFLPLAPPATFSHTPCSPQPPASFASVPYVCAWPLPLASHILPTSSCHLFSAALLCSGSRAVSSSILSLVLPCSARQKEGWQLWVGPGQGWRGWSLSGGGGPTEFVTSPRYTGRSPLHAPSSQVSPMLPWPCAPHLPHEPSQSGAGSGSTPALAPNPGLKPELSCHWPFASTSDEDSFPHCIILVGGGELFLDWSKYGG